MKHFQNHQIVLVLDSKYFLTFPILDFHKKRELFFAAPFGGAYEGERWIKENLFKDSPEVRFLYHEGKKRGKRILCKRGKNVSAMASLKWHNENMPLVAAPMQLEKDVASLLG